MISDISTFLILQQKPNRDQQYSEAAVGGCRYIFDEENLLYWLDENWNINDIPENFMNNRNQYIRNTAIRMLELKE